MDNWNDCVRQESLKGKHKSEQDKKRKKYLLTFQKRARRNSILSFVICFLFATKILIASCTGIDALSQ